MPWWGLLAAVLLIVLHVLANWDLYKFKDSAQYQFNHPQVEESASRIGRHVDKLDIGAVAVDEVVRFRIPRMPRPLTSRIVALEGQRVKIEQGILYVDGAKATDGYKRAGNKVDYFPELIVPEGCVFVLNDQRWRKGSDRSDSRAFGPIHVRSITHSFSPRKRSKSKGRRR